jgi:NitT/TauT family transport system substrate-binding protein
LDYLRDATEETLRPVWQTLSQVAHTFPPNMETMTVDEFAKVLPVYKETGALKGTVDLHSLIDRTYLEQAIKELA